MIDMIGCYILFQESEPILFQNLFLKVVSELFYTVFQSPWLTGEFLHMMFYDHNSKIASQSKKFYHSDTVRDVV